MMNRMIDWLEAQLGAERPSHMEEHNEKDAILSEEFSVDDDLKKIGKDDTRKERRHKLKHSFERNNVIMTVAKKDIIQDPEEEINETDLYQGSLKIKRIIKDENGARRVTTKVPNCCVICLESYEKGDVVVWAPSHTECQHAFHQKCIVKYFLKNQKKVAGTPCPCCRREFTDLTVEKRRRKRDMARSQENQQNRAVVSTRSGMCSLACPFSLSIFFERRRG